MKKIKFKTKNILLILFIVVFLFSTTKIVLFLLDSNKNKNDTKELIQNVISIDLEEEKEVFKIDFEKLLSINSDTIGWIRFNQDKINNPIVHTKDNTYYLKRSFEKESNQAGTIFMDYRNESFNDRNVVLFGHSMLYLKMNFLIKRKITIFKYTIKIMNFWLIKYLVITL